MANEITKLDLTDFVCNQTGDCGEQIDRDGKGGGIFVSQTTGGVVEFSGEDVTVVDFSIDNLDQFVRENQKPVGIYTSIHKSPKFHITPEELERFKGHRKPEPLKDTINWERDERQFDGEDTQREPLSSGYDRALQVDESRPKRREEGLHGESIRHVLTPKQKKLFIKKFEKAMEIYMKTSAKPADAELLSEGLELEKQTWDIPKEGRSYKEEGLRGEEIRMERYPNFDTEHIERYFHENDIAASLRPIIESMKRDILINKSNRKQMDPLLLDESGVAPARKKE